MLRCVLIVAALAGVALALPGGPPVTACTTISPAAGPTQHRVQAQEGNGDYFVYTDLPLNTGMEVYNYTAGGTYGIVVRHVDPNVQLRGFMVQAVDPSDALIGTFAPSGNMQALVNCPNNAAATIGHVNRDRIDFLPEMFTWTAPPGEDGFVNFRFAVVKTLTMYYANQNAAVVDINTPDPVTAAPTNSAPATTTCASLVIALFSAMAVWHTL